MAKGNLLLGMGRGKLGDIVLSRTNGQQISRARARTIKNPKTTAQTVQRLITTANARAYSAMKAITNHSFQAYSYGANNMSRFLQLNADMLRTKLADKGLDNQGTDTPSDAFAYYPSPNAQNPRGAAPGNWIISEGTLTTIPFTTDAGNAPVDNARGVSIKIAAEGTQLTYAQCVKALGLQPGDQLTVCAIDSANNFKYGRFILSPDSADMSASVTDLEQMNERNSNLDVSVNNGALVLKLNNLTPDVQGNTGIVHTLGVIVSRKEGQNWLRSNTTMQVVTDDPAEFGISFDDAITRSEKGELNFESPYYLNNANRMKKEAEEEDGGNEPTNP